MQLINAESPIEVTFLGMFTYVKLLQLEKADLPIDVTLFEIVNEVNLEQSSNA